MKRITIASLALAFFFCAGLGAQTTNIAIGTTTLQSGVKRPGINLGQQTPYGSQQFLKNLISFNPGFNNAMYASIIYCTSGTNATLCVSGTGGGTSYPSGFWPVDGTTTITVISPGNAQNGCTATLSAWTGVDYTLSAACGSGTLSAGDYITVRKVITSTESGFNATNGWTTGGSGATYGVSTDVPPAALGTTYTQSLQVSTPAGGYSYLEGSGDYQYIPSAIGSGGVTPFINLNGTYTISYWAKQVSSVSGPAQVIVSFQRGGTFYLNFTTDNLTTTWTQYTHTFTASETGTQTQGLQLNLNTNTTGEVILLNKVSVTEATTSGNPTVFRDAVVNQLKAMKPGVIRMWDSVGLTNTLNNMLVDQWARMPMDFKAYPTNGSPGYYNPISYSIPEFLQLCQTVGSEAWIALPVTLTPTEATYLIDYLSGGSGTAGGALRIAQGFSTPWTSVISKIHLELGNEEWNGGSFEGGSMEYGNRTGGAFATYGAWADYLFATMKADSNYVGSATSLVLGGFFVSPGGFSQVAQNVCSHNDEQDAAPYMDAYLTDSSSTANIWQPALAEPQVFWQTGTSSGSTQVCAEGFGGSACPSQQYFTNGGTQYGGAMLLNQFGLAHATYPKTLAIYEESNSSNQGNYTQSQYLAYNTAWGQGLAQASEFLNNMANGVMTQNFFQLGQYFTNAVSPGGEYVLIWGSMIDMGGPTGSRQRPQALVQTAINNAITTGGTMLATTQTGTPTFGVGTPASSTTVNTVATAAVNTLQSFAFNNGGGSYALILLNYDISNTQAVTFSGANAPTGSVTQVYLNSTNLSDTNESSNLIAPVTSTLTSPSGLTMQPHSMYVLTWGGSTPTPATYYVSNSGSDSNNGTSTGTPWQTISKVNSTTRVPGDTVLFQKGGTWHEQLTASVSGTSGNVITYGAYGTGAAPIIDGGGLTTWTNVSGNVWSTTTSTTSQTCHASSTCLQLPNFGGTAGVPVASQAAVTGALDYYFDGVTTLYVYSTTNPASTVEVPTRNYGFDLGGQNYITVSGLQFQGALYYGLNCQSSSTGCSNLMLTGNTTTLNVSNGVNLLTTTNGSRMTGDTISSNTSTYNGSSGIKVGGYWQGFTDSGNTASYNCIVASTSAYYDNQFCGGIYVFGAGSSADGTYSGTYNATEGTGTTFTGDTTSYNGQGGGTNTNIGNGTWIDTVTSVTVTSETSYGNLNNNLYAEKTIGSTFRHNLGYGGGTNTGTGCFTLAAGQTYNSKNNVVLENTCDGGYSAFLTNFESSAGVMISNTIQNNIFYQHTGTNIAYLSYLAINTISGSGGGTGNVFVTNAFGAPRTNMFYYNAAYYSTYAAFETAFGASTNSLQVDPALISPPTNYGLTSGSPARGFGTTYSGYPPVCGGSHPDLGYLPYACSSTITLTPSAPAVAVGQNITITASAAVTFTLAGAGTCTGCGTAGATSISYTAPSTIAPQHVMLGCQVMPNDSVFNTRIDALPVNSNSATWISYSSNVGVNLQPSWGISYANASTPVHATFLSYYGEYSNPNFPWPTYGDMKREGGNFMGSTGFAAPDHHVMTVRVNDCNFFETYNDQLNGHTVTCQNGTTTGCNVSSAITYPWSTYAVSTTGGGVDAAGLPLAALVPTLSEVKAGAINHAMRYTAAVGYIQGNGNTGTPLLWPASLSNGCGAYVGASGLACYNTSGVAYYPPIIGARERLKSSFNISTFSATAQIFLLAMQRYGMVLADIGSNNSITTTSDLTTDATVVSAINEITAANIGISNFEFVDESSLEVASTSYQVCPNGQTCAGAQNTYETPLNQAIITATPASGTAVSAPIAIEAVTIGSKVGPDVLIQAGAYSWTVPTFVNGSSNQTVNWTLSGSGSLSGAVYTPPSTTGGSGTTLSATLTGTAAADSTATIKLYLTILPVGTIRLDTGAASNTTDGSSNTWLGNLQPEGWGAIQNDYPNWQSSNPLVGQYQSNVYAYGNDLTYNNIIVPNGNYDVSFLLGLNSQCGQIPCGSYPQCRAAACNGASAPSGYSSIYTYGPINLESQGELGYNTYDWLATVGYVSATPTPLVTIPAKVTNNVLYAAVRGISNDVTPYLAPGYNPGGGGLQKAEYLSGLQIAADAGSPHWTVSTQQQTSIASGQTLNPFLVIDWFTGVNDPVWSIVSAPAGISINAGTGVLTAASGTYLAGQPVTVKASDGTYSATATIYTAGSSYLLNVHP